MRFFLHRRRRTTEADLFESVLTGTENHTPELEPLLRLAAAMQPARPLNEARRVEMKAAMMQAAERAHTREMSDLEAGRAQAEVHSVAVVTDDGVVKLADLETINPETAAKAARAALNHLHARHGGGW